MNKVLLITDIFGCGESILQLKKQLEQLEYQVTILDPYQGQFLSFRDEQEAYQNFSQQCGHQAYFEQAKHMLVAEGSDCVVGFSAGASCAWRLAAESGLGVRQVICFYPTKIRDQLDLQPRVNTQIIFPDVEPLFDVVAVSTQLAKKSNLSIERVAYQHGFMNSDKTAYSKQGETFGQQVILERLEQLPIKRI